MRLSALDEAASAAGLKKGQGVAEARAMHPGLDVVQADPAADRRFLEALADWCDRYTPLVAIDGEDGLMLDISGCAHLFGGEDAMLRQVVERLSGLGLKVKGAIASNPGLSWAAARFTGGGLVVADEEAEALLSPLPVQALRIAAETAALLKRVGLKRIGDIIAAPRAPLARRFGADLLLRLDQVLGREGEAISPRRPLAMMSVERQLVEPIREEEEILELTGHLAEGLVGGLEARGEGGRLFELLLFRVDGRVFRIEVGTASPLRAARRIRSLFTERLRVLQEDIDAGYGFELARLNVLRGEILRESQGQLDGDDGKQERLAVFFDQAAARLGARCLRTPMAAPSHWPDRASILVPLLDGLPEPQADATPPIRGARPIRLFSYPELVDVTAEVPDGPPASFRWRRTHHRVARAEGPERLTAEWWIDGEDALPRDYFRIEDMTGRRFWLYRQGLYERGAVSPQWFMQGIFA